MNQDSRIKNLPQYYFHDHETEESFPEHPAQILTDSKASQQVI